MRIHTHLTLIFLSIVSIAVHAQSQSGIDSTGLPGDHFSLQGALQMFQKASSIEEFEKMINTENNHVNNLDLNGDGEIDYVKVIDKSEGDAHAFILQVPVSENENQDIAVIELEKTGNESAMIQIIGDEDIYGEEIIVEPDGGEEEVNTKKTSGPFYELNYEYQAVRVVVNVWVWPSVRFVYGPAYRPWVSPWRWRHYPAWWKPWHPFEWRVWHPYHIAYRRSFVIVPTHRVVRAHAIYKPYHTSSVIVRTRHSTAIGNYRVTRSRTTITGPRGNNTTIRRTTVNGPRGRKTAVRKRRRG